MDSQTLKILVALTMTVSVIACDRGSHEELNIWGYPRIVSRTEAEFLLRSVIDAARSPDRTSCRPESDFDRSGRLVPELLARKTEDIVDYGQFPGENRSVIELILKTPRWPERGLSVTVHVQNKQCVTYALSTTRSVEQISNSPQQRDPN